MFGRLTSAAIRHDMVATVGALTMLLFGVAVVSYLFYTHRWKWFWREWLTSLDPKKIGVMYLVVTGLMLLKGVIDALMMRAQQAIAVAPSQGYLSAEHFQQVFSAHGATMIFFVGMGLVFAVMNLMIPLQIGARDVAYPFLNSLSFWLFAVGAIFINLSLVLGDFAATGWVAYPPLSGLKYSPGVGVDYWLWSIQISGAGSLLSGINFLVTILTMRAPGMTLMKMPIFVWSCLNSLVLIVFAFPILTATGGMLALDRLLDMHFFTPELGGSPMMYINLIWAWGHPEVYILILPAFGIFSETVATFSQKRLFGYVSMVWALVAITFLSFIVWLHHFFTMGAGANVNAFFGIMTMLIAVPTGVKIFNWLFTMYQGRVQFKTPMLWFLGFVFIFVTGGATGVFMSIAPLDFQVHNSLFLIAHFHSMMIGGVLFAFFAGFSYWFPKFTGFLLEEKWGRYAFFFWFVGFIMAFFPLYLLGFMGATRRLDHYEGFVGWQPLFVIALVGALFIFIGIGFQIAQLITSIKHRRQNGVGADPFNGRTLEWSIASPPPEYNFAHIPTVTCRDAFWEMKQKKQAFKGPYEDIHLPKNSPLGLIIGLLSFCAGFGLIWYIWWLVIASTVGILVCLILRIWQRETEFTLKASQIERQMS